MVSTHESPLPRCRVEPARGAPDLDEHLLRHLLGLRRVPQHAAGQPEHARREQVVEPGEGRVVTAGDGPQEVVDHYAFRLRRGQAHLGRPWTDSPTTGSPWTEVRSCHVGSLP